MADITEPPAKKARLDVDAEHGVSSLDAPSSPVDDLDDDFYGTATVSPTSAGVHTGETSHTAAAVAPKPASQSSHIPGLGLWGAPPAPQASAQNVPFHRGSDEGPEEGELSDSDSFYGDVKAVDAVTTNTQGEVRAPQQNGGDASATATLDVETAQSPKTLGASSPTASAPADIVATAPIAAESSGLADDGKAEFLQAAEANKKNADAEWQLDSEQSDSDSSSDSSSDDSSSDDEEASEDGELLDPEEMVRRLMAEDKDDSGPSTKAKVRTHNEVAEEYKKPNIEVKEDTKITELGKVESIVDNLVVIKANTSGDYQVLESGSALCLENRTVIGQVSETIGRVQEPRYSVGFADPAEITTLGIAKDTPVYYVNEHSTFVFTEPLKAQKYTDASNLHDEETGEPEFSDDEKEAEYKRQQKEMKKARNQTNYEPRESGRPSMHPDAHPPAMPTYYQGGALNYSDDDDEDLGMYKPLTRPEHFENVVGAGAPIEDRSHVRRGMMRGGRGGRGGWIDRGRGFRGRGGRGGRGGMGGNGFRDDRSGDFYKQPHAPARHQEQNRPRNGPPQDHRNRSAASASPARQDHGRPPPQHSPPRGKNKRKRNRHTSPQQPTQTPAAANANAYASNNAQSSAGYSAPYSAPAPPTYTQAPVNPPAFPPTAYVNPAFYPQQAQAPAPAQNPQQQQLAMAQWLQMAAAAMQTQNQPQQQPQPQPQAQYAYPYPYQQNAGPSATNAQQNNGQAANLSLQDIMRALGRGSGA
ncbi:NAF1-domain-containing protein [Trematosphaeria pertusa]|uniref:H/ACA ribonucleoprotein complex non-core subunit NAF1 n=1 Tax=Trematosphaeria pertusa TaxID=390896 RepID=A0A6A6HTX8_9PLEO|nr:NAF1-domain-containing protein [Trematosphaeria pertusa]KAF2240880.1 NAF1-domain-containing protein [Trematosphaeria pertusa]